MNTQITCPVCGVPDVQNQIPYTRTFHYGCKRCGNYSITDSAESVIRQKSPSERALLSHYIARVNFFSRKKNEDEIFIKTEDVERILKDYNFPTIQESIDLFITLIGKETASFIQYSFH